MNKTRKHQWIGWILMIGVLTTVLSSCAGAPRKCNGDRAIMTPMGPM